jgi:hypothetical protein
MLTKCQSRFGYAEVIDEFALILRRITFNRVFS